MKSFAFGLAAAASLACAASIDTANDWDTVTASTCADVAVIFARGTFDSG